MSSDDDMRVECSLERFERERVAHKSSDLLLSRIAGGVSDEQFLEVAVLDGTARSRIAYDLWKLEQSLNDIHTAKSHGLDTWIDRRHVTQLLGPGCSDDQYSQLDRQSGRRSWTCNS